MKIRYFLLLITIALLTAGCSEKSDVKFVEGKHYIVSKIHQPAANPQIIKFVSFACPACRKIEEVLADYKPSDDVTYERFQVRFGNASYDQLMRAYSTLRVLNIHDKLAEQLFVAIQDERTFLGDRHSLAIWVAKHLPEVNMEVVKNAYLHEKTAELVAMYYAAEQKYKITSIPTIWVNGNILLNLKNLEGETNEEKELFLRDLLDHLTGGNENNDTIALNKDM